ncbi:MAG TPA: hypothetical protein VMZ71_13565 [Gemmataceae bacterium]|nr:hypothetical protein [Gemmataceae bacterium]
MMLRLLLPALVLAFPPLSAPAAACPFCPTAGQTLSGEVASADFILFGKLVNPKQDTTDPTALNKGTTEMEVELVIKSHDMIKGKKTVTLPRFVPPDGKDQKYLIFFNVFNGQIDPYRGEPVSADSKLPDYLKGAIEVKSKDTQTRMKFFFDFLESSDLVISTDAFSEFGVADYKDVRPLAEKLDPAVIMKWLKDPNTRASRFGLYGLLIGHCGKASDAKAIRELLNDSTRAYSSGLDGVMAGYIMLDQKAGWEYLTALVKDAKQEFPVRYAALKTVRFFWEYRPDVIPNKQVLEAMHALMEQPDLADLPMEDLRKWKCWDQTPKVLAYAEKESHNTIPIVARAMLKFALNAAKEDPKNAAAVEFVRQQREKNPKKVEFLEDLLKDELKPTPPPPAKTEAPARPN